MNTETFQIDLNALEPLKLDPSVSHLTDAERSSPYSAQIAPAGITMSRYLRGILIGIAGLAAAHAFADQLEEHDPVRVARRLKDCVAQHLAMHDGRTHTAIRQGCKKAIVEGSYHDPNISLDGMIKSPPQQ